MTKKKKRIYMTKANTFTKRSLPLHKIMKRVSAFLTTEYLAVKGAFLAI